MPMADPHACSVLDRALPERPRLGDANVERHLGQGLGERAVRGKRRGDAVGLRGENHVEKPAVAEVLDEALGRGNELLR